jgi:hypothetical protein
MLVDPNKTSNFRSCGRGRKVLALVGLDRRKNQKDNWQYEIHWACVQDLSAPEGEDGDKGADHWDRCVLTENALWRLGALMKAAGYTQPFDSDDAKLIADVLGKCYVIADVKVRQYDGEDRSETKTWSPYSGPEGEDWADIIAKGIENHAKLRESRKKGAGGGGNSGGSQGGGTPRRQRSGEDPEVDGGGFQDDPEANNW